MSGEWKPGDVVSAYIETRGRRHMAVRVDNDRWPWRLLGGHSGDDPVADRLVKDPTRLAVIDPEDREQVGQLVDLLHDGGPWFSGGVNKPTHTSLLQKALHEFLTPRPPKPPKPDEPAGLGAVVRDAAGKAWVCCWTSPQRSWALSENGGVIYRRFAEIDAVEVLSEGWSA